MTKLNKMCNWREKSILSLVSERFSPSGSFPCWGHYPKGPQEAGGGAGWGLRSGEHLAVALKMDKRRRVTKRKWQAMDRLSRFVTFSSKRLKSLINH